MVRSESDNIVSALLVCTMLLGLVLVLPGDGEAQTITVNNNLVFGNIFPGIPKTISKYTAGAAAEFLISGSAGSEITIDLTLPTYMSQSGFNMQMIFNESDCSYDGLPNPDQSNPEWDNQDPWHTITDRLGAQGITLWLGGTVVPKLNQMNGAYTASIVMTVAYTGN